MRVRFIWTVPFDGPQDLPNHGLRLARSWVGLSQHSPGLRDQVLADYAVSHLDTPDRLLGHERGLLVPRSNDIRLSQHGDLLHLDLGLDLCRSLLALGLEDKPVPMGPTPFLVGGPNVHFDLVRSLEMVGGLGVCSLGNWGC